MVAMADALQGFLTVMNSCQVTDVLFTSGYILITLL